MELEANMVLDEYRRLYFEGGTSSAYYFETSEEEDSTAFGCTWLIHKNVEESKNLKNGFWDSVHVFEINPDSDGYFIYNLNSSVTLSLTLTDKNIGDVDLSGTLTKTAERRYKVSNEKPHIEIIGALMEELELQIRNEIEEIYISKTGQVITGMRQPKSKAKAAWADVTNSLKARKFKLN